MESNNFTHFIDQIPSEIMSETEHHGHTDIMVFRPRLFIGGGEMCLEDYHFVFLTSHPPLLRIERKEYQLKKGRLVKFTPETKMTCTRTVATRPYIAMNIKKKFFQEVAYEVCREKPLSCNVMDSPYSPKLINLIHSWEEEVGLQNSTDLMIQSISTQIVIQILRESGNQKCEQKKQSINKNYVNRAKEYMFSYYNSNIKMDDICKEINLSPYYFIRIFKEHTQQTPHEFLISIRITKAEEMLKKGGYSIEEVAKYCGFVNSSHFSNCFKKLKGIPPSTYKRSF